MPERWLGATPPDRALAPGIVEAVQLYMTASKAPNTVRAYGSDMRDFEAWCRAYSQQPLPATPQTVALYLTALAEIGYKPASIQRRRSAISAAHRLAGHLPSPASDWQVQVTMAGINRRLGRAPAQKVALSIADLRTLLAATASETAAGARDRALLLLGFAGGFRRGELVALDVEDLAVTDQGLRVTIRRSKTDQEGVGREVGIPWGGQTTTCPIRAVGAWRVAGHIDSGPLFRPIDRHGRVGATRLSDRAVARVIQRAAEHAGLDPRRYAGHSLRAGLATAAAAAGAPERAIMAQTGHRSVTTLRRYIRSGTLFEENAAGYLGL